MKVLKSIGKTIKIIFWLSIASFWGTIYITIILGEYLQDQYNAIRIQKRINGRLISCN